MRRSIVSLFLIFACVATVFASTEYAIGDQGPSGGWVFYDCDADNDSGNGDGLVSQECGWRYLEASPTDLPSRYPWGDPGHFDLPEFIGAGLSNSEILVFRSKTMTNIAARACLDWSINGFDDWFLPSLNELQLMYENLHRKNLGNFNKRTVYWSSTENGGDIDLALGMKFSNGSLYDDDRTPELLVRPVRRFL